jgi:putative spermidine/putrescine transport system permease protein
MAWSTRAWWPVGLVDEPVEWLLFSDFSVVLAFVHLYTMFMIVPIFNSA